MNPPKCCGVCVKFSLRGCSIDDLDGSGDTLEGQCGEWGFLVDHRDATCSNFDRARVVIAADVPRLIWKRDCEGVWFVRSGDVELTVKYNIEVERWEWCAGMAVEEWVECERGLRKTRAGAMRAAEAHVDRVRKVMS